MQERREIRALVVGAGVGGLTAAIALRKVGVEAMVFERVRSADQIRVGTGTHFWSNAMRVYQKIGLADQIEAGGSEVEHTEFWTSRGKLLADWKVGEQGRTLGVPSIGVIRAEVQRVLLGALGHEAVRFGAECTGFSQDATGVTAQFGGGREEHGDVLIGADGINSVIRDLVVGPTKPRYSGWTVWLGVQTSMPELCPVGIHRIVSGPGARFVFHHAGEGCLAWLAMENAPEGRPDAPSGRKAEVLDRFRGYMEPIEAIVEATEDPVIRRQDMYYCKPLKQWGTGRVSMLGDAAHAMTSHVGQGACQAIEDGYVLARCLGEDGDIVSALRSYEAQRLGRTTLISNVAWRMGSMGRWKNPVACLARDQIMRVLFSGVAGRQNEKFVAQEV